jgi:hypothetical protein
MLSSNSPPPNIIIRYLTQTQQIVLMSDKSIEGDTSAEEAQKRTDESYVIFEAGSAYREAVERATRKLQADVGPDLSEALCRSMTEAGTILKAIKQSNAFSYPNTTRITYILTEYQEKQLDRKAGAYVAGYTISGTTERYGYADLPLVTLQGVSRLYRTDRIWAGKTDITCSALPEIQVRLSNDPNLQ